MSDTQDLSFGSSGGQSDALKKFQLDPLTIKQKSDKAWGIDLAKKIDITVNGGNSSYFFSRNNRWRKNRNSANGRADMTKFVDLLQFNGKDNYINMNWQCIHIVNRIISGLVGRWMTRNEKIQVTATDSLSVKDKQEEYDQIEFIIDNRAKLEKLQAESGVQLIPDKDLPGDKEELKLWQAQFQRLPEEILYELGCNDVLASCGWFDVLKEKMLHDSAEVGFVGTYTWMDDTGVIHVEWVKPENAIYSYSSYPDFRDTSWRGRLTTYKISELRRKYGADFGGDLSEEDLFKLAVTAKEYQLYDQITWMNMWNVTFTRPYDEWNVDVLEFELKTVDTDVYTKTTTKKNKSTILRKGRPDKKEDNQEVIEDTKWNIYRGVYARLPQMLLEWGLKDNMIRPQDPKELGNAEFSYSFYMPQNFDMTNLAVPEKIEEPAEQMILARLRIQQLVMKMKPIGSLINWEAMQNIDYGLGDANKTIDVKKLYDQTGDLYYRGTDAEGRQIPVPVTELKASGFLEQLQGLIQLYQFHYQVLKDELGEDPNLIQQAAQPRVAVQNIETSQQQAEYATDYLYSAYTNCMADTARKISCLLNKSVIYGSAAYRGIVGKDDIDGRIFSTKVQFLPDAFAIQKFEALLQKAMDTAPELVLFLDPFQLMRIAKEDVKLAETVFRQGQKKMLLHQQATAAANQKQVIDGQIASAQAAEEGKRETEKQKGDIDIAKTKMAGDAQNRNSVISMATAWLTPKADGTLGSIPPEYKPLIQSVVDNIMVSAIAATEEQKAKIIAEMQAARDEQEQQMQQPMQGQQQMDMQQNQQVA